MGYVVLCVVCRESEGLMAEQPRIAELWMEVLVYGGEEYLAKESKVVDR